MVVSLRARIMMGFLAVLGLSLAGFAATLQIAKGFQAADADRNRAVQQVHQANLIGDRARMAQITAAEYLRTRSGEARDGMKASLAQLSAALSDGGRKGELDSLKVQSLSTVDAIDAAELSGSRLVDAAASLSNPAAALGRGRIAHRRARPDRRRLEHAVVGWADGVGGGPAGLVGGRAVPRTIGRRVLALARGRACHRGRARDAPGMHRLTAVLAVVADAFDQSIWDFNAAFIRRSDESRNLNLLLRKAADASLEAERFATQRFEKAASSAAKATQTLMSTMLISATLVCVVGVVLAIVLGASISQPIIDLKRCVVRIAAGEFGAVVPGLGRSDEIGLMARAVGIFKENGVKLKVTEAAAVEAAEQQRLAVEAVAEGLARLSGGELAFRLADSFPPGYAKLRRDFNAATEKLSGAMSVVSHNTAAIKGGTSEISAASLDLSRRTEQQAASLEETAAALDQIATGVRETAASARHARSVVGSTKTDAEESARIVGQAIKAMNAIDASAGQVRRIVAVIDDIAFQTNLLALNAAVEAARAGESGRGFAVVASEVRALAHRSAASAEEIKALISASSSHVDRGVGLVGQTGAALERIMLQVVEINEIVKTISAATDSQASSLAEVNVAMTLMEQTTQRNAAMVEETTAASQALAEEADGLARLIDHFEVGSAPYREPDHCLNRAGRPLRAAFAPRLAFADAIEGPHATAA